MDRYVDIERTNVTGIDKKCNGLRTILDCKHGHPACRQPEMDVPFYLKLVAAVNAYTQITRR
jgi:hypothetical protein